MLLLMLCTISVRRDSMDVFSVACMLFNGKYILVSECVLESCKISQSFYLRENFDQWLDLCCERKMMEREHKTRKIRLLQMSELPHCSSIAEKDE